ncbi:unnamed protein product [Paramecium sonneborni]|uniref:Uncharacterized protein n=1 Tax=Paramecium sonneborni TaxID=65129 RepID=A0A8S1R4N5_9CILI|nr:unnamed protein product [Paramecium sonneborni]
MKLKQQYKIKALIGHKKQNSYNDKRKSKQQMTIMNYLFNYDLI